MMDPLHFFIAVGPIAVYLLLLGILNLSRRPFLTTGPRDTAALGVAVSGLVLAGPMELFLPEAAANRFGPFVWILMIAFYGLCLSLVCLLIRPRLVIYNATSDQIRPLLVQVVSELDRDARWAGDCVTLPNYEVQFHLESWGALRIVQLVSAGPRQSYSGWRRLEVLLSQAIRKSSSPPSPIGIGLVIVSAAIAVVTSVWMATDQQSIAQSLHEMLRR